jgi:cation-transporting ATPase I
LADAVVGAARSGGRRLLLTEHAGVAELLPWADRVVPAGARLADVVRRLQAEGEVVLVVTPSDDQALAAADVGVGLLPRPGAAHPVCWSADLLCGPGLAQVWRVLTAVDAARRVSAKSAHLAMGGSALGGLIAATGSRRTRPGLTGSPVYGAALLAQLGGLGAARRVGGQPLPAAPARTPTTRPQQTPTRPGGPATSPPSCAPSPASSPH